MSDNLIIILAILAAMLSITFRGIYALIGRVGHYEVKRKAQAKTPGAHTLYVLHRRGYEPLIGLTIWQMIFTALFILLLIKVTTIIVSVSVATTVLTLGGEAFGSFYIQNFLRKRLDKIWPLLNRMLQVVKPLSVPPARLLEKRFGQTKPVIYSREHLLAIIEEHGGSKISDVSDDETLMVKKALEFKHLQVRKVMTPLQGGPIVSSEAVVGPVLLDELYKSGLSLFPVGQNGANHIAGTVSLRRLAAMRGGGKVSSVMDDELPFIGEEASLREALELYASTHSGSFLVTNRFDDVVGILSLEQIIYQLTGVVAAKVETPAEASVESETVVE